MGWISATGVIQRAHKSLLRHRVAAIRLASILISLLTLGKALAASWNLVMWQRGGGVYQE